MLVDTDCVFTPVGLADSESDPVVVTDVVGEADEVTLVETETEVDKEKLGEPLEEGDIVTLMDAVGEEDVVVQGEADRLPDCVGEFDKEEVMVGDSEAFIDEVPEEVMRELAVSVDETQPEKVADTDADTEADVVGVTSITVNVADDESDGNVDADIVNDEEPVNDKETVAV